MNKTIYVTLVMLLANALGVVEFNDTGIILFIVVSLMMDYRYRNM